jgi:hypothetical protein
LTDTPFQGATLRDYIIDSCFPNPPRQKKTLLVYYRSYVKQGDEILCEFKILHPYQVVKEAAFNESNLSIGPESLLLGVVSG